MTGAETNDAGLADENRLRSAEAGVTGGISAWAGTEVETEVPGGRTAKIVTGGGTCDKGLAAESKVGSMRTTAVAVGGPPEGISD